MCPKRPKTLAGVYFFLRHEALMGPRRTRAYGRCACSAFRGLETMVSLPRFEPVICAIIGYNTGQTDGNGTDPSTASSSSSSRAQRLQHRVSRSTDRAPGAHSPATAAQRPRVHLCGRRRLLLLHRGGRPSRRHGDQRHPSAAAMPASPSTARRLVGLGLADSTSIRMATPFTSIRAPTPASTASSPPPRYRATPTRRSTAASSTPASSTASPPSATAPRQRHLPRPDQRRLRGHPPI